MKVIIWYLSALLRLQNGNNVVKITNLMYFLLGAGYVRFTMLVPNCPVPNMFSSAKLSIFLSWCKIACLLAWCQIVCFFYLGSKLSYHHILSSKMYLTGPLIYSSIQEIWFFVTFSLPATFIFTRVFNRLKVWILCQSYFVNLHQQGTKSCHNNKHTKIETKRRMAAPNRMNFQKSSKGGGGHFQSKDLFFNNLCFNDCIEKNQNKTHFEEGSSTHTSLRDRSGYQNR